MAKALESRLRQATHVAARRGSPVCKDLHWSPADQLWGGQQACTNDSQPLRGDTVGRPRATHHETVMCHTRHFATYEACWERPLTGTPEHMTLKKTDKALMELASRQRTLNVKERALLLLADGGHTRSDIAGACTVHRRHAGPTGVRRFSGSVPSPPLRASSQHHNTNQKPMCWHKAMQTSRHPCRLTGSTANAHWPRPACTCST
jgi:hypothetical protein